MNNTLQAARNAIGMTQPQLSEKLRAVEPRTDVGMVSRYERGVCLPTKEQIARLEEVLGVSRLELWDPADLDLLAGVEIPEEPEKKTDGRPSHQEKVRKCFRVSRKYAEALPPDLLDVCGFNSWQGWFDNALHILVARYYAIEGARKRREAE